MPDNDTPTGPVPIPSPSATQRAEAPVRDWWGMAGMIIAAASAVVASFSSLYGLAAVAG